MPAQDNMAFLVSQLAHVEPEIYRTKYAEIQYTGLIPVDTSANPFVKTVTYYSMDGKGSANWINAKADDFPTVATRMEKHETQVHMAGIGFDYDEEELGQAQLLGQNITAEKGILARRAYEEFVDRIALQGDVSKGFEGLFDNSAVTAAAVPNGAGGGSTWAGKTSDEILNDVNDMLTGVYVDTNTVAMADTLLLPFVEFNRIASKRLADLSETTVLEFLRTKNVYTATTGQPLLMRAARKLDAAGAGGTKRMIAYRRNPEVLKLHIPMPYRVMAPQKHMLKYIVPAMFRLGGLDIRLPKEVRYADGI